MKKKKKLKKVRRCRLCGRIRGGRVLSYRKKRQKKYKKWFICYRCVSDDAENPNVKEVIINRVGRHEAVARLEFQIADLSNKFGKVTDLNKRILKILDGCGFMLIYKKSIKLKKKIAKGKEK